MESGEKPAAPVGAVHKSPKSRMRYEVLLRSGEIVPVPRWLWCWWPRALRRTVLDD